MSLCGCGVVEKVDEEAKTDLSYLGVCMRHNFGLKPPFGNEWGLSDHTMTYHVWVGGALWFRSVARSDSDSNLSCDSVRAVPNILPHHLFIAFNTC